MKFVETPLKDVYILEPAVFGDERGFFQETWNREKFSEAGFDLDFVQDNHSRSARGILRGLHFQTEHPQDKLVWAPHGEVLDVVLDLRKQSPTFGKWEGFHLTGAHFLQLFVTKGFAHGYVVLSETAEFAYKCSDFYDPKGEGGVIWNDPDLDIDWKVDNPILSGKDLELPRLKDLR